MLKAIEAKVVFFLSDLSVSCYKTPNYYLKSCHWLICFCQTAKWWAILSEQFVWFVWLCSFYITDFSVYISEGAQAKTVMNLMFLIEAYVPCWDQCWNRCQNHKENKPCAVHCMSELSSLVQSQSSVVCIWETPLKQMELNLAPDLRIQTDCNGEKEGSANLINLLD